jgi:hypothetical protein
MPAAGFWPIRLWRARSFPPRNSSGCRATANGVVGTTRCGTWCSWVVRILRETPFPTRPTRSWTKRRSSARSLTCMLTAPASSPSSSRQCSTTRGASPGPTVHAGHVRPDYSIPYRAALDGHRRDPQCGAGRGQEHPVHARDLCARRHAEGNQGEYDPPGTGRAVPQGNDRPARRVRGRRGWRNHGGTHY